MTFELRPHTTKLHAKTKTKRAVVLPADELPPQQPLPVTNQQIHSEGLGEHVGWLGLRVDSLEAEWSPFAASVLHEMEVLVVDVLGPGTHPGNRSNRQRAVVVLEGGAMDNRLIRDDVESQLLHFVEHAMEGDGLAKS